MRTADGVEHELDVLVFATGFDVVDGNYRAMDLRGREGPPRQRALGRRGPDQLPWPGQSMVPDHVHDPRPDSWIFGASSFAVSGLDRQVRRIA
ncbi:hypothetical protein [Amycolatopsis sp. cmx-11-12]|uniref:hypothetical protein n=1 Tax=Amycolatopsis sp. cmx-11-12 TaxID=2785795 RepID=UPI003917F8EB